MESHPPAKAWETYRETDSKKLPLRLNPCGHRARRDGGRLMNRAVLYESENRFKYEQLIIYRDVRHAERTMKLLRADLRKCANVGKGINHVRYWTKPLDLGDDGLRAGGRFWENGEQAVVVRRGAAVYIVGESAWPTRSLPISRFRHLIGQAEQMSVKVCDVPRAAC